jgi:hypothetical protein
MLTLQVNVQSNSYFRGPDIVLPIFWGASWKMGNAAVVRLCVLSIIQIGETKKEIYPEMCRFLEHRLPTEIMKPLLWLFNSEEGAGVKWENPDIHLEVYQ